MAKLQIGPALCVWKRPWLRGWHETATPGPRTAREPTLWAAPKETKDLYIENYKTLVKEIKEDTNRWRNIPFSWIGRINIVKMSILPKEIYRFNAIPIKLPTVFFTELEQIISQFVWKYKKTSNSQSNLEKEKWNWRNQPAWLQALLQSYSHQDSMVLAQRQKYRSMEQNRKPRDKSTHIWTPYLWQRRQKYTVEKRHLFNKWYWENWSTTCKRMKLEHFLTLNSSVQSFSRVRLFATPWTARGHRAKLLVWQAGHNP